MFWQTEEEENKLTECLHLSSIFTAFVIETFSIVGRPKVWDVFTTEVCLFVCSSTKTLIHWQSQQREKRQ